MKRLTTAALILLIPAAAAWAGDRKTVVGSGKPATESRELAKFDELELRGTGDVEITIGRRGPLEITADDNILPLITTEIKDGRLIISVTGNTRTKTELTYKVTVPDIKAVELAGSGEISIKGVDNKRLSLQIKGSGDVSVSGQTGQLSIALKGSGDVNASKLSAKSVSIAIIGSGDANVSVEDNLSVSIKGSGDVTYRGNPQVAKSVTGSGEVHKKR